MTTSDVQTSRIGAEGAKVGGGVDDEEAVDQVEEEAGVRPRIPPTWSSIGVTLIMIIIIVMIMMMTISITEMILGEKFSLKTSAGLLYPQLLVQYSGRWFKSSLLLRLLYSILNSF